MVVFDGVRGGWQADVLMVVCCVWKRLPTVTVGVSSSNSGNNRLREFNEFPANPQTAEAGRVKSDAQARHLSKKNGTSCSTRSVETSPPANQSLDYSNKSNGATTKHNKTMANSPLLASEPVPSPIAPSPIAYMRRPRRMSSLAAGTMALIMGEFA
eukprot:scaffold69_cov198-Alexandrium_tamarense.AAC.40